MTKAERYFPPRSGAEWEMVSPEEAGFDSAAPVRSGATGPSIINGWAVGLGAEAKVHEALLRHLFRL